MKPTEFFKKWKQGIQKITPLQQVKINIMGSIIVFSGVIIGLITMIITRIWWLLVILSGSLFLVTMSFMGTLQKYWALKKIDDMIKEDQEETNLKGTLDGFEVANVLKKGESEKEVKENE